MKLKFYYKNISSLNWILKASTKFDKTNLKFRIIKPTMDLGETETRFECLKI